MKQRIAAGAIVLDGDSILMVNHKKIGFYDFWVAPGGGVIGTESLEQAAIREVKEETGLKVSSGPLLYIEEFWQPSQREVKFWYLCHLQGGEIDTSADEAIQEHIVAAQFMSRDELNQHTVFPDIVTERLWQDLSKPPIHPVYLGLRKMEFY